MAATVRCRQSLRSGEQAEILCQTHGVNRALRHKERASARHGGDLAAGVNGCAGRTSFKVPVAEAQQPHAFKAARAYSGRLDRMAPERG